MHGTLSAGILSVFLRILMCVAIPVSGSHAASSAWKPTRNVELIAPAGPGGGNDLVARKIQKILQEKRLVEVTSSVVNKPGGSGIAAWDYLNQHPGDGHFLSLAPSSLIANHVRGVSSFSHTDITPIALLFSQYSTIVVRADSPIRTMKDLADRLKKDPGSVSFALALGMGGASHLAVVGVARAIGIDHRKLRLVSYKSAGETLTNVLGGHVDVTATTATNTLSFLESGKVRVIGVTSPRRLAGPFANVPTLREQGIDVTEVSWRMMIGPKGLRPDQLAYWDNVFATLAKTDEWNKELEKELQVNTYLNSKDSREYLETEYAEYKALLTELGLTKK